MSDKFKIVPMQDKDENEAMLKELEGKRFFAVVVTGNNCEIYIPDSFSLGEILIGLELAKMTALKGLSERKP